MNKKISLGAAIAFILIIAAATFSITMTYAQKTFNNTIPSFKQRQAMGEKFVEIDTTVREYYNGEINDTQLFDSIAKGYLAGIGDEYAEYLTPEQYAKYLSQPAEGERTGVGISAEENQEGYLLIKDVYPDSPAHLADIRKDDLIVSINDTDLNKDNVANLKTLLSGRQGDTVNIGIRRSGEEFTKDMTYTVIVVPSIVSYIIPGTKTGYIRIKEFNSNTSDQFNTEYKKLYEDGIDSLIFDVRDNKGGVLKQARRVIDSIIPAGTIYTAKKKSIDGVTQNEIRETSDANEINLPMVTIINKNTASEAELFAQVLKDYEKAPTVGETTAGKGVIQEIFKLSDGSALKLTVAYIESPKKVIFNGEGVTADFYEGSGDEDFTKLTYETDPQLIRAIDVVSGLKNAGTSGS